MLVESCPAFRYGYNETLHQIPCSPLEPDPMLGLRDLAAKWAIDPNVTQKRFANFKKLSLDFCLLHDRSFLGRRGLFLFFATSLPWTCSQQKDWHHIFLLTLSSAQILCFLFSHQRQHTLANFCSICLMVLFIHLEGFLDLMAISPRISYATPESLRVTQRGHYNEFSCMRTQHRMKDIWLTFLEWSGLSDRLIFVVSLCLCEEVISKGKMCLNHKTTNRLLYVSLNIHT